MESVSSQQRLSISSKLIVRIWPTVVALDVDFVLLNEELLTFNKLLLYFYLNNSMMTSNITDNLACFFD